MAEIMNTSQRMLQAAKIRLGIEYASPEVFTQHSVKKWHIEILVNTIKAGAGKNTQSRETFKNACDDISDEVKAFLVASRVCFASGEDYSNDFQWAQDILSSAETEATVLRNIRESLLIDTKLSPLLPLGRYAEAQRQLEVIESGKSTISFKDFQSLATAFLKASKIIHINPQDYANDLQRIKNAQKIISNLNKTNEESKPETPRTRKTNFSKAIDAAIVTFGRKPSFAELWQFFQDDRGDTKYIVDFDDNKITWVDTKGNLHDVTKRALQNQLAKRKR